MRLYTKVVLGPSGEVLESAWTEYVGPVALLKGGGGGATIVEAPKPSEEEKALQKKQTEILEQQLQITKDQFEESKLVSPLLFEKAGLRAIKDSSGTVIGYEEIVDPLQAKRESIESQFLDRSEAALKGELPIAPQLIREMDENERILREALRKDLGPGYETSSPGIEALGKFSERKSGLFEAARRDDLSLAEQLGLSREMANEDRVSRFLSQVSGVNRLPMGFAEGFGQTAAGFGQAQGFYRNQRQMEFQAAIANAQNASRGRSGGLLGSLFGGVGSGVGSAAGTAVGSAIFSDRRIKTNIKQIGTLSNGLPIYVFNYIFGGPMRIGLMAQDVELVNPIAVTELAGIKMVDYSLAIK